MIWAELAVVLAAIFLGSRLGGIGLGLMGMVGVSALVFGFGLPPGGPPGSVIAIIVAVVTAAAAMQASGGMEYLVVVAGRLLRARPQWITFVAPLVAYLFTFCAGTGHVAYSILPVIAETARKAGVRPERPMSISVIASQTAITASPIAAATAALIALLEPKGIGLKEILLIAVPATLLGVLAGAISVMKRGKELADDEEALARAAASDAAGGEGGAGAARALEGTALARAQRSVLIFLLAAGAIVLFGMFKQLRPVFPSSKDPESFDLVEMGAIIQFVMYSAAAAIFAFCGARADATVRTPVMTAGLVAVISIVGLGWLGTCFYGGNKAEIDAALSDTVRAHPWVFSVALFGLSVILFSQASTVSTLMPVGIALQLPASTLIASFPAVNGYFFLPTYATSIAAANFDRTGTTHLGTIVLNHSFMRPGLVTTVVALVAGFLIAGVVL
ncbi:MAG TPA: anaerobic C4-dicarboxylate transporter family protein [Planctomycetota bacterium]|nr:anaerobic C4-dicarboxylate transporter family protein [Planctomycetota bacterium]